MAAVKKQCRVCGKEYEACRSLNRTVGVFRWQEVACSPECGSIYLQQINVSRAQAEAPAETVKRGKRRAVAVDEAAPAEEIVMGE